MTAPIRFEFDDTKAEANVAKHGVLFSEGVAVFDDANVVVEDASRLVEGEVRTRAIGLIRDRLFTVVFTMRGEVCRIISVRRSNKREMWSYGDC